MVAQDSMKLFHLAEKSLLQNSHLKRVIILKRIFRCDSQAKQSLSRFANTVYDQLWESRGRPSNIIIADQNLSSEGRLRDLRFGFPTHRNFDGVHLHGTQGIQHYTRSVIDVFTKVFPSLTNPQDRNSGN